MKTRDKIIFGILAFSAFCWIVYLVRSVLPPFICSLVIAYFLNPLVNRIAMKYKTSRLVATSLILGLFFTICTATAVILLPIIYAQLSSLIDALPSYFRVITTEFYPKIAKTLGDFGFALEADFSHMMAAENIHGKLTELSQNILSNALTSSATIINILSLTFITPILIFYFLKDWTSLIDKIHSFLPGKISSRVDLIAKDVDRILSGYVRGQFNVCIILSLIYSILLSLTGLNFGFIIGFLTGMFSFIPYVGMLCGVTVAIVAALFQWGFDFHQIGFISLIFLFGQIVESNFLTPKLIGSKIGVHPVWIIFGLFFFGSLFGFVGILIAVPLTAICGILAKHLVAKYKQPLS